MKVKINKRTIHDVLFKNMAKFSARLRAREMRRNGLALNDISKRLGVSKASASVWCSDISLTVDQRKQLERKRVRGSLRGRLLGAAMNKAKRLSNMKTQRDAAITMVKQLNDRDMLMLGIAL